MVRRTSRDEFVACRHPLFAAERLIMPTIRICLILLPAVAIGCNGLSIRSQSPEDEIVVESNKRKLIGDVSVPFGLFPIRVETPALVTGLPGTGSDPGPSPERAYVVSEMQKQGVQSPNQILASPATDIVVVRGYLRPGIQKGDRFDLEVRVPTRSENTGLRGGWLMEMKLKEIAAADGMWREGSDVAIAQGPILVDPTADERSDKVLASRGRVLGGGVSTISRPIGLVLRDAYKNVAVSAAAGAAINRRFHTYDKGIKVGVCTPKTDQFLELKVHPRYKDNVERYVRVIRALALKETPQEQAARLKTLENNLLDPLSSATAALRLEAIGKDAIPVLKKGAASTNVEVRFYAAESLAYLDEASAAPILGEIARDQPAFRAFALAALGAMDEFDAFEALKGLLATQSAETRYGAFRALWAMNKNDPLIRDEAVTDQFKYHVVNIDGPEMVHITRNTRAELVLFGRNQKFVPPVRLEAGPQIMINSIDGDRLSVSRFAVGQPDQKKIVSLSVDEMIRAVAELGGTYPDVVQALQQAKAARSYAGRLEIDAVPEAGREYQRTAVVSADEKLTPEQEKAAAEAIRGGAESPVPDLFNVDGRKQTPDEQRSSRRSAKRKAKEGDGTPDDSASGSTAPSDQGALAGAGAEEAEKSTQTPEKPASDESKPSIWNRFLGTMRGT
jgi:hypothetical protein